MSDESRRSRQPVYYRVVLVRNDGIRETLARNLSQNSAESAKMGLRSRGRVVVERQEGMEPTGKE